MGLIKAAVGSVSGTLQDQWKEAIRCEEMGNDVLVVKKTTPTKVISNGSTVIVGPGQCAIIFDNGRIVDASAEEGFYTFDSSSSPSLFAGDFGGFFKEMWQRFTYNGASAKEQAVFFFNTKQIINNLYGTQAPIPFQDWSHPIPNQMTGSMTPLSVKVRSHGTYVFRITNPFQFMNEVSGMSDVYRTSDITDQIKSEVLAAFQNVLNELGNSNHRVPVLELPSQTDEIKKMMSEKEFDTDIRNRGMAIVGFNIESVTLDDASQEKIDKYELSSNSAMQQGTLVGAYANAVQDAAKNPNGSMNGFMGVGMMNMASGGMFGGVTTNVMNTQPQQPQQVYDPYAQRPQQAPVQPAASEAPVQPAASVAPVAPEAPATTERKCSNCGAPLVGKFCTECGTNNEVVEAPAPAPEAPAKVFCGNCGKEVLPGAKFCTECGTPVQQ